MAESKFNLEYFLINAVLILFIAGVASAFMGGILATIESALAGIVVGLWTVIMAILAGYLLYSAKLTNFVEIIVLLGIASGLGTLIASFVPSVSPFLFTAGAMTWSGLISTLFYVALADYIGDKLGY